MFKTGINDYLHLSDEELSLFKVRYSDAYEAAFNDNKVEFLMALKDLFHLSVSIIDIQNEYGLSLYEMCQFYGMEAFVKIILDYEKSLISKNLISQTLLSKELNLCMIRKDFTSLSDLSDSISVINSYDCCVGSSRRAMRSMSKSF